MSRPQKYGSHKLEAYGLYQQRKALGENVSPLDIHEDLQETHPEGTASYRLVADWIREFKRQDDRQALLDSPFRWHLMEQCGLPWEASNYLLEMWRLNVEGNLIAYEVILADGSIGTPQLVPTNRQARWWWRVHRAAPNLSFSEVNILTDDFVLRELDHEILGLPLEMADLQAFLAYRPWEGLPEDDSRYEAYRQAINQGRIPRLQRVRMSIQSTS
jgi:hypothetical protein